MIRRKKLLFSFLFLTMCQLVISLFILQAQNSSTEGPRAPNPQELADEWFTRLNALSDWHISVDGREENETVVDRFVELYAPDAFHQVGPSENQIGPVVLHGTDAIRWWADQFSKKYVDLNYRVEYKTRRERTLQPFYTTEFPWGGTGAAAQFDAIYTNREDRRQFVVPSAVFFIFDEMGKIDTVRLYVLRDETQEIG